jgi:hypothetical protein
MWHHVLQAEISFNDRIDDMIYGGDYQRTGFQFHSLPSQAIDWLEPSAVAYNTSIRLRVRGKHFVASSTACCVINGTMIPGTFLGTSFADEDVLECIIPIGLLGKSDMDTSKDAVTVSVSTNGQHFSETSFLTFTDTDHASVDGVQNNTAGEAVAMHVTTMVGSGVSESHDSVYAEFYRGSTPLPLEISAGQRITAGSYRVSANLTVAGQYLVFISVSGSAIDGSPFSAVVSPATLHIPSCTASADGHNSYNVKARSLSYETQDAWAQFFESFHRNQASCVVGNKCHATVYFRDRFSNLVDISDTSFTVVLTKTSENSDEGLYVSPSRLAPGEVSSMPFWFTALERSTYLLGITSENIHILGSPFLVDVNSNIPSYLKTTITDPQRVITAGDSGHILIVAADILGNVHERGGFSEGFEVTSHDSQTDEVFTTTTHITDLLNGNYSVHFNSSLAGHYRISVRIRGVDVQRSPQSVSVRAADTMASTSSVSFVNTIQSGNIGTFVVQERDIYGNPQTSELHSQIQAADEAALPSATDWDEWINSGNTSATPDSCAGINRVSFKVEIFGPLVPEFNASSATDQNGSTRSGTDFVLSTTKFLAVAPDHIPLVWVSCDSARGTRSYRFKILATGLYQLYVGLAGINIVMSPQIFAVKPKPLTVTQMSPTIGPTTGGTVVSIHANFEDADNFLAYLYYVEPTSFVCRFDDLHSTTAIIDYDSKVISCRTPSANDFVVSRVDVRAGEQDFQNSNVTFTYHETISGMTVMPPMGPRQGGTVINFMSESLVESLNAACKFDMAIVNAVSSGNGFMSCMAPPSERPEVAVSFTLDGQHYSDAKATFQYYAGNVEISSLNPAIGPVEGQTEILIVGTNFANTSDLLRCQFEHATASVYVTAQFISESAIVCRSPRAVVNGIVSLRVAVNGFDYSLGLQFQFYHPPEVVAIYPSNGHPYSSGGSIEIQLRSLSSWSVFFDSTPLCKFAGGPMVPGELAANGSVKCLAPAVNFCQEVVVEVTLNGQQFTSSDLEFGYTSILTDMMPNFGPLAGATVVNVTAIGIELNHTPLENIRCRFGVADEPAIDVGTTYTMLSMLHTKVVCRSPNIALPSPVSVALSVDSGKRFSESQHSQNFSYYALAVLRARPLLVPITGVEAVLSVAKSFPPEMVLEQPHAGIDANDKLPPYLKYSGYTWTVGLNASNATNVTNATASTCTGPRGQVRNVCNPNTSITNAANATVTNGKACVTSKMYCELGATTVGIRFHTRVNGTREVILEGVATFFPVLDIIYVTIPNMTHVPLMPADATIEVSLNGQQFTSDAVAVNIYDPAISPKLDSLSPKSVQATGGTNLTIDGSNFANASSLSCRLSLWHPNGTKDGENIIFSAFFTSSNQLQCTAPDISTITLYGITVAFIAVANDGVTWSNSMLEFKYSSSSTNYSSPHGTMMTNTSYAGVMASFIIVARASGTEKQMSGGDTFYVTLVPRCDARLPLEPETQHCELYRPSFPAYTIDMDLLTYPDVAGEHTRLYSPSNLVRAEVPFYHVAVESSIFDTIYVRNRCMYPEESPNMILRGCISQCRGFRDLKQAQDFCDTKVECSGVTKKYSGQMPYECRKERELYKPTGGGGDIAYRKEASGVHADCHTTEGEYISFSNVTISGKYNVRIELGGHEIYGSPFPIYVAPASLSEEHSVVGNMPTNTEVGEENWMFVQSKDVFRNNLTVSDGMNNILLQYHSDWCSSGWEGSLCQRDEDECISAPCQNGGTCKDSTTSTSIDVDAYVCFCVPGYSGPTCGADIDECLSVPCHNGATCVDSWTNSLTPTDSYICECVLGYTGEHCGTNPDNCGSEFGLCVDHGHPTYGRCWDRVNDYFCDCSKGWGGKECGEAVNTCSRDENICHDLAQCSVLGPGQIECRCHTGYEGPGTTANGGCWDYDECSSDPCQNTATCAASPQNETMPLDEYSCACASGFFGYNCDVETYDCWRNPCENGGHCTDMANAYECSCSNEWTGDNCNIAPMWPKREQHCRVEEGGTNADNINCSRHAERTFVVPSAAQPSNTGFWDVSVNFKRTGAYTFHAILNDFTAKVTGQNIFVHPSQLDIETSQVVSWRRFQHAANEEMFLQIVAKDRFGNVRELLKDTFFANMSLSTATAATSCAVIACSRDNGTYIVHVPTLSGPFNLYWGSITNSTVHHSAVVHKINVTATILHIPNCVAEPQNMTVTAGILGSAVVTASDVYENERLMPEPFPLVANFIGRDSSSALKVYGTDLKDGTHEVPFVLTISGSYDMHLSAVSRFATLLSTLLSTISKLVH